MTLWEPRTNFLKSKSNQNFEILTFETNDISANDAYAVDQITRLDRNRFNHPPKLKTISLHDNNLTVVEDACEEMSSLLLLWIYENKIRIVAANAIQGLTSLTSLFSSENESCHWKELSKVFRNSLTATYSKIEFYKSARWISQERSLRSKYISEEIISH